MRVVLAQNAHGALGVVYLGDKIDQHAAQMMERRQQIVLIMQGRIAALAFSRADRHTGDFIRARAQRGVVNAGRGLYLVGRDGAFLHERRGISGGGSRIGLPPGASGSGS